MVNEMEFEKPVFELKKKISELKEFTKGSDVDLSNEIEKLENRLQKLEQDIYENMKPWERVSSRPSSESSPPPSIISINLSLIFMECTVIAPTGMMKRSFPESAVSTGACDHHRPSAGERYEGKHQAQLRDASS